MGGGILIFHSSLDISHENKVDIVLSVMSSVREQIGQWHSSSYAVASWSIAIMLGVVAYWLKSGHVNDKFFISTGVFLFLVMGQIYLYFSQDAIKKNGAVLVKCEAALRLSESNAYLHECKFFESSSTGEWVLPVEIKALRLFHVVVGLISTMAIVIMNPTQ